MPATRVTSKSPWHVIFIIDDSGSMASNNGAESVNEAMNVMIEEMQLLSQGQKPYFKISVISFGSDVTVLATATSEMTISTDTVTRFTGDSGSTNAAAALSEALRLLQKHPGSPTDFEPFVFFLSDGEPDDDGLALSAGNQIKDMKLPSGSPRLVTIGLGTQPNHDFMMALASHRELYKHLEDPKKIKAFLPAIGTVAGTAVGASGVEEAIMRF